MPHANRKISGKSERHSRSTIRRDRGARSSQAGESAATASRRVHHGQRRLRRTRSKSCAAGGAIRRTRTRGGCHDNQQGVRLRIESGRTCGAGNRNRQQFHRGRRWHGVHDQRALSSAERAQGISSGQRTTGRLHGARRTVGHLQRLSHGADGRERCRKIRHHPRRAGRVRRQLAPQSRRRPKGMPLQVADCSCRNPGKEKRPAARNLRQG